MEMKCPVFESFVRIGICVGIAASLATVVAALPRALLRQELETSLRKWIVRDHQGNYLLLSPQHGSGNRGGFSLRMSQGSSPESLSDFGPSYPLEPPLKNRGVLISAGISLDRHDRIHLVWSTATGLTGVAVVDFPGAGGTDLVWKNSQTNSPGALVLADEYSRIGDIATAMDGSVWFTWTESITDRRASIHLGRVHDGRLSSWRIARGDGLFPASLFLDEQERFHLGWHDIYEESYYASGRLDQLDDPKAAMVVRLPGRAFQPVLTRTQGRTLAVYEDTYSHLMTVLPEDASPRAVPLTRSRPRFAWHTFHSPQFALDRYGVAWLFFVDSARRHVFRTRWLGEDWGPVHNTAKLTRNSPRMEDNHLSIDRLAVETGMGEGEPGIKILVTHGDQQVLRSVPVPSLEASPGKKVLFLDLAEVQALANLRLRVNQAQKHPGNPVIQAGEEGDPDVHGAGNFLRVLKEDGVYRMWYSTMRRDRSIPWWEWYGAGYAESTDGYRFRKKELVRNTPYVPMVLKDANARNPNRRYKLLKFPTHGSRAQAARAGRYNPWQETNTGTLSTSRDGIEWIPEPAIMFFPGGRPFSLMPQSVLYDPEEKDPDKRYKAYGFSSLNLARRGGGYAYSPDAYHWTAHPDNPMLDPFARAIPVVRGGKVEQIHDWVVWKDGDYYLSFYQYQHNGRELDLELAISRDGENFVFVDPGRKVVPSGAAGEWDCDHIAPSLPLVDDREIRVYYGAICGEGTRGERRSGGVAVLRLDGYTRLELKEPGRGATLTTIPVSPAGASQLHVNADCGDGGTLLAELLDPESGGPLPGFHRSDSVPFRGNTVSHRMSWTGGRSLSDVDRTFQVRFHLVGSEGYPHLYSFSFK